MPSDGWIEASYIANFAIKKHNVRFIDGVTNDNIKTEVVNHGGTATAPNVPTHDGYEFIGWDKKFDNVTEDITVTAVYRELNVSPAVKPSDDTSSEPNDNQAQEPQQQETVAPQVKSVTNDLPQTGIDMTGSIAALATSISAIIGIAAIKRRK